MKPIKTQSFIIQILLITLAASFATLGLILSSKTLTFTDAVWGYLDHGDLHFPITLGIIATMNLAMFLSYLFVYLNFEFYGIKTAFYTTLALCFILALNFILLKFVVQYGVFVQDGPPDTALKELLIVKDQTIITTVLSIGIGFPVALFFAAIIKKITRNYFMFIRYPIASIIGFALVVGVLTYFDHMKLRDPQLWLIYMSIPAGQFLGLIIASVIPLYVLRLFLGLFRGKAATADTDDVETNSDNSLFRGNNPDDVLPPPPDANQNENIIETTVSEKIKLDKVAE